MLKVIENYNLIKQVFKSYGLNDVYQYEVSKQLKKVLNKQIKIERRIINKNLCILEPYEPHTKYHNLMKDFIFYDSGKVINEYLRKLYKGGTYVRHRKMLNFNFK